MRVVVGITGASGAMVAVRALEMLKAQGVETHAVVSSWGKVNLKHECGMVPRDLEHLVRRMHSNKDLASPLASGSFKVDAALIVPCSARTLGTIAAGTGEGLISRVADVAIKERRRLVLGLREAPLSSIHLRNALQISDAGGIIAPLSPAFYTQPGSVAEMFTTMAARLLDHCGVEVPELPRWGEDVSLDTPPPAA